MLVNLLQVRIFGQTLLHEKDYPANIHRLAEKYYEKFNIKYKDINLEQALSIPPVREKAQMEAVDLSSLAVEDARTFGGEHLCTQVLKRLELSGCLGSVGFNEREINLASIAIIGRALFTASEYKTASFLEINSELQRMHGHDGQKISHYSLYKIADKLYDKKEIIDKHLYKTVKDLFNLNDTLVIYDLSNTYFEGRKASSQLAQFGKNKEKRNDCKQVVFTGVINQQGFIRHSRVYEGNTSDIPTLKDMIEDLKAHSGNSGKNVVVMDAGIASQENLTYLSGEGLKYVCVARKQIKDYQISPGEPVTRIKDKRDNPIELQIFSPSGYSDTWMYVKSQQKRIKEQSINDKISSRFEQELKSFSDGLARKGTTKKLEKVWERLGRLKEKYRLVSGKYTIDVISSGKLATEIVWQKKTQQHAMDQDNNGVYFIRTNINQVHETMFWDIYNTVREVESTFRCLKSDLQIRPAFHQKDDRIESHIYLAILAYQLVNTIRHMLKAKGIHLDWRNIKRKMATQTIQSIIINSETKKFSIRKPSKPIKEVLEIYQATNSNSMIPDRKKYVVYH
jgi:transposase